MIQSELGNKVLVSRATISDLLDRLEKEDLVVRSTDPSDKRVFRVCLTDKAARIMNLFIPLHNEYIHKIMSSLDKHEKEVVISLLEKIRKGLE